MTDIQERQELADKIKQCDLDMLALSRYKSTPDEEFRAAYLQRGILLRQYRGKYGQEAEYQLRDQLDAARKAYAQKADAPHVYREPNMCVIRVEAPCGDDICRYKASVPCDELEALIRKERKHDTE